MAEQVFSQWEDYIIMKKMGPDPMVYDLQMSGILNEMIGYQNSSVGNAH